MSICYVIVRRLLQRNYGDVGRRGLSCGEITGELNFCVADELS
jgi:hypothetical protein